LVAPAVAAAAGGAGDGGGINASLIDRCVYLPVVV